jgi:hypothetical protein
MCDQLPSRDGFRWFPMKTISSTGYQVLDVAVLNALIKWRFRPQAVTTVRVPVIFVGGVDSIRTTS